MTTWWWVRHGPTHAKGLIGATDLPADLSDTAALGRLARFLPADAKVVSSDLSRSVATADAIQSGRARLHHLRELREINFGDWETKSAADVARSHPEISRQYWENPGDIAPPGGESWNQTARRVDRIVDRLNAEIGGGDIVAVAHFGVILTQLQRAAGLSAKAALAFRIDNLSVTRLEFLDPGWRVQGVNHCP